MDLESRVTKLEEQQYFQERLLQDLDAELRSQTDKFAELQRQLAAVTRDVQVLRELLKPEDVRPPHSAPEQF